MQTSTAASQTQTQLQFGYYSGSTAITIQYSDIYGNPAGTQTFQSNVLVRLGSPAVAGGIVESNPFNLYIIPDPPEATAEGVYEIHSALGYSEVPAQPVVSPITGNPVPSSAGGTHETGVSDLLLQYWQLQLTSNTTFEGVLTNPHNQEAVTINLFNATKEIAPNIPMVWPYPMAAGTQIASQSNGNTLSLALTGNSIDGSRPFRAEVSASRIA